MSVHDWPAIRSLVRRIPDLPPSLKAKADKSAKKIGTRLLLNRGDREHYCMLNGIGTRVDIYPKGDALS